MSLQASYFYFFSFQENLQCSFSAYIFNLFLNYTWVKQFLSILLQSGTPKKKIALKFAYANVLHNQKKWLVYRNWYLLFKTWAGLDKSYYLACTKQSNTKQSKSKQSGKLWKLTKKQSKKLSQVIIVLTSR